jgi:hypothetical protein
MATFSWQKGFGTMRRFSLDEIGAYESENVECTTYGTV